MGFSEEQKKRVAESLRKMEGKKKPIVPDNVPDDIRDWERVGLSKEEFNRQYPLTDKEVFKPDVLNIDPATPILKAPKPIIEETPVLESPVAELRFGLGNKMALAEREESPEGTTLESIILAVIIAKRKGLDLTQKDMAEAIGMSVVNYSNIERGFTGLLLGNLSKICIKLNLKITIQ